MRNLVERNHTIDYFKFWAIFSVICIHTAPFNGTVFMGIDGKHINLLISTIARFGVPYFFVVSGYFFGQKILTQHNSNNYFKRYFIKIIKLFLYWEIFYFIYGLALSVLISIIKDLSMATEVINYLSTFMGLKEVILFIFYGRAGGPASVHLWYLSALIWSILGVYVFIKINRLNVLLFLSLLLNLIGLFGQTYSGVFNLEFLNINIPTRDALFFVLFYTTFGAYVALNYNLIKPRLDKVKSSTLVVLFFLFSTAQLGERIIANILWHEKIRSADFYISTIFLTIFLFLLTILSLTVERVKNSGGPC